MRLRKTLKQTAAATLALGMALSAAAPTVSAAYVCDVSQGSVNIAVDEEGIKTIQVNGEDVTDDGDGTDDIIITGDSTQAAATQNDAEETSSAAEDSENVPSEDETDQTGSAKETGNDKGSVEPAAPEQPAPTAAPAGDRTAEPPAKPETTVTETKDGTVTEYGAFEADPDVQAEKPVVKAKAAEEPASDPAENEPDDKIMTYEAPAEENTSVVSSVAAHVVKIVNNCTDTLNIILRNLKVDAGTSKEDAMNISGTGDVTLELDGKNELIGGIGAKNYGDVTAGLHSRRLDGTLTITDENKDGGSLTSKGGNSDASHPRSSGGIYANDLAIIETTVTAKGGDSVNTPGGKGLDAASLTIVDSSLSATGGNSSNTSNAPGSSASGGIGLLVGNYVNKGSSISNSHISAVGGDAFSSSSNVSGGSGAVFYGTCPGFQMDHVTFLAQGGNASSDTGSASGGCGFDRNGHTSSIAGEFAAIGGNATTVSGTAKGGDGYYSLCYYAPAHADSSLRLASGNFTAIGGSGSTANGNSILYETDYRYNSPMKISDGVNLNVYQTGDDEFALQDDFVPSDHGAFTYYKNATVIQNEDGSVTVTGEPFRYVNDGHVYTIASRTDTTIIWHCDDAGVEDLELPIPAGSTFDAMKHEWVTSEDGTYEECTICHTKKMLPQPAPDQTDSTETGGSTATAVPASLHLRVVDADGHDVAFGTRTEGSNYVVDARRDGLDTATLVAPLPVLRELQAAGIETLTFETNLRTTTLNLTTLLALGSGDDEAQLRHTGDVPTLTVGGIEHNELL